MNKRAAYILPARGRLPGVIDRGAKQSRFPSIWLRDNIPSGYLTPEGDAGSISPS